jgi:hypothetical protein
MATIQDLRYELGDTSVEFPIMSDAEYTYFLDKNSGSLQRASLDAAKSIMLKLSMRSDSVVDIFSIKGTQAAKNYMQALQMYIKNPDLNKIFDNLMPYAGGISKTDMLNNEANLDNNAVIPPSQSSGNFDVLNYGG